MTTSTPPRVTRPADRGGDMARGGDKATLVVRWPTTGHDWSVWLRRRARFKLAIRRWAARCAADDPNFDAAAERDHLYNLLGLTDDNTRALLTEHRRQR